MFIHIKKTLKHSLLNQHHIKKAETYKTETTKH